MISMVVIFGLLLYFDGLHPSLAYDALSGLIGFKKTPMISDGLHPSLIDDALSGLFRLLSSLPGAMASPSLRDSVLSGLFSLLLNAFIIMYR